MFPTTKNDPGARLLDAKFTTPELSVAVGSVQETTVPPILKPISLMTSSMQFTIGALLSTEMKELLQLCHLHLPVKCVANT